MGEVRNLGADKMLEKRQTLTQGPPLKGWEEIAPRWLNE